MKKLVLVATLMAASVMAEEQKNSAALAALDQFDEENNQENFDEQIAADFVNFFNSVDFQNCLINYLKKAEVKKQERIIELLKMFIVGSDLINRPEAVKQMEKFQELIPALQNGSLSEKEQTERMELVQKECPLILQFLSVTGEFNLFQAQLTQAFGSIELDEVAAKIIKGLEVA